jgi:hypothetical protein
LGIFSLISQLINRLSSTKLPLPNQRGRPPHHQPFNPTRLFLLPYDAGKFLRSAPRLAASASAPTRRRLAAVPSRAPARGGGGGRLGSVSAGRGQTARETMARSMRTCLHSGRLALLAILVSGGIVLQILACALYNNWWPMLTVLMYLILPMPLIFFLGSNSPSMMSNDGDTWVSFTKFLTGASIVGSIAIPSILKHAGVIGWGALTMELSSFLVFGVAILWLIQMNSEDEYSSAF